MFFLMLLTTIGWLLPFLAVVALVKYVRSPSRSGDPLLERRVELLERELEVARNEMRKLGEETEFYRRLYAGGTAPESPVAPTPAAPPQPSPSD